MRDGRRNRSRDAPRPFRRVCGARGSGGYSYIIKKSMVKNGDGSRNSYHELYREHGSMLPSYRAEYSYRTTGAQRSGDMTSGDQWRHALA